MIRPTHVETYMITVPVYAMVKHDKGGHSRTTVGSRQVRVQVAVNLERLAEDLGPRAARSKHQRATGLHGQVRVQVVR